MVQPTRRGFLAFMAAAAVPQGLGQFSSGPPPCDPSKTPTPAAPAGPDYKPDAPMRTWVIDAGTTGTRVAITGTLSGVTCGLIKGAVMEFWQADDKGVYDKTGFRLRGRQTTDANGAFHLDTIVPGAVGTHAPVLHVRATPPGKKPFTTQLFFPDQPANKTDPDFKPELLMQAKAGTVKTATFNILLDI